MKTYHWVSLVTYHWDVIGCFIWDLLETSWRHADGTSSLSPHEKSSRHTNKTSWGRAAETSGRRSTETSLGVSFETYLQRHWDVQRDVVTMLPRRLLAGWDPSYMRKVFEHGSQGRTISKRYFTKLKVLSWKTNMEQGSLSYIDPSLRNKLLDSMKRIKKSI